MNIQQAYNHWASKYDEVQNRTRDLEGLCLQEILSKYSFSSVLEIGCGTGKNTQWLLSKAKRVACVDFSDEMLSKAKEKIKSDTIDFIQADIKQEWNFNIQQVDLVTFSLVLEHVQNLDFVFKEARSFLRSGGLLYVGELHPFKQYQGSKARFETDTGIFELDCFLHHVSDFFSAAEKNGFECIELKEGFDNNDFSSIPRLLILVFKVK